MGGSVHEELPMCPDGDVGPSENTSDAWACPHYFTRTKLLNTYRPKSLTGFVGLKNQGGTCYLNSLLQTLFMTPEFRMRLLEWKFDPDVRPDRHIPYQLQALFARMQASEVAALDTKPLTASFGWDSSDTFVQHDVQELNRVLFHAIEQSAKRAQVSCFLADLYEAELVDYLRCTGCRGRRQRVDKYQDVALVVKGCPTLEASLDSYVQPEMLEGIDCETCGGKRDAEKGFEFRGFPSILTLQLRRFDFDFQTLQRVKVHDAMRIPFLLDVRRWLLDPVNASGHVEFQLLSILLHRGTALGGHYFAYIRDIAADKWYEFNDEHVEEVPLEQVRNCLHHQPDVSRVQEPDPEQPDSLTGVVLGENLQGPTPPYAPSHNGRATPYMLVYRSTSLPPVDLSQCSLPPTFAEAIAEENREAMKQGEMFAMVKDLIEVKVHYAGAARWVVCPQALSLEEFTTLAYDKMLTPEEQAKVPRDQVRIRSYNPSYSVCGRSFGADGQRPLKELGLTALSNVALEVRAPHEEWEDYSCDDLVLRVQVWQAAAELWDDRPTRLRGDATAERLAAHLSALCGIDEEYLAVSYKDTPTRGKHITREMYPLRLRDDLNFGQGDSLFVEDSRHCPVDDKGHLQLQGIRAIESVNFWTFHFNVPPGEDPAEGIVFDARRTFQDLKMAIGQRLGLPPSEFRLKRDQRSHLEAGNPMTSTIKYTMLQSGSRLFVELGRPLSDSDLNISVYKYTLDSGAEHLELLFKRIVPRDLPLTDLKRDLAEATGIPVDRLRLREVSGNGVRQALTLRTLRDHYADGRGNAPKVAAQEVAAPESLTSNDLILRVTPYRPPAERIGLGEQQEIVVDRNFTVRQLKRKIGDMYNMEHLSLAKALNAVLDTPQNVLFDNIGLLTSVDQYHDSVITKHPLNLRDNDHLLFKEGQDFTKPSAAASNKKSKPEAGKADRPAEKALVIRTDFEADPEPVPVAPIMEPQSLPPLGVSLNLKALASAGEFDDTAAELGDDDRSEIRSLPDVEDLPPDEDYGPGGVEPEPEQYDTVLHVITWDVGAFTDMDPACSICLADYEDDEQVGITPCLHSFHPDCFHPWFTLNSSCPICLIPLPPA